MQRIDMYKSNLWCYNNMNCEEENNNVVRNGNGGTEFTVRLHFAKKNQDAHILEEIQEILAETYIRHIRQKGGDWLA